MSTIKNKRLALRAYKVRVKQKYGGKSERTKELRSETPMGFAYAFYEANHGPYEECE